MTAVSNLRLLTSLSTMSMTLAGVALWTLFGSTATQGGNPPPATAATPAAVAAVDRREVALWEEFSGRLEAIERVDLRPRVSGAIDAVHFREGSRVRKGDLLFTIDPAPYLAEVEKADAQVGAAEANLAFARGELERGMKMIANQAIAQRDLDTRLNNVREAEANLNAAKAVAKAARLNLSYTDVRAPISGRAGRIEVTTGNLVSGGSNAPVLTTIVSTDPIYVSFDADERAVQRSLETLPSEGDRRDHLARIPVELRAGPEDQVVRGKLQLIDHSVNGASGTVRMRAVLENGEDRLMPGQFARVRLGQASPTSVLVVPERSIGVDQDKRYVLVVDPSRKTQYREIKLGAAVDGGRIVTSGLNSGEQIVVEGLQKIRPGTLIEPRPEGLETSASLQRQSSSASAEN